MTLPPSATGNFAWAGHDVIVVVSVYLTDSQGKESSLSPSPSPASCELRAANCERSIRRFVMLHALHKKHLIVQRFRGSCTDSVVQNLSSPWLGRGDKR